MCGVAERLSMADDVPQEVKDRHIERYRLAIEAVKFNGGLWLDAACGTGYGTAMIANTADLVLGIDKSKRALGTARARSRRPGRQPNVLFLHDDLARPSPRLQWLVQKADAVLSIETIEHLDEYGQEEWIKFVGRSRDSATLVLSCPIGDGGRSANPHHLHEPTEDELIRRCARYFHAVEVVAQLRAVMTSGVEQDNLIIRCRP